jgi:DNA-binding transcriptional ArsR family regulator
MTDGVRDEEALRQYVEKMARFLADWGFPRMAARVLLLMMAADEESLTAAEIAERLSISPAAVSGAVRYLQQLELVVREPVAGSRRDRYHTPHDTWYQGALVKGGLFATLAELSAEGAVAAGGPSTPAGARLEEMSEFYEFLQVEVSGLLEKWRAQRGLIP